MSEYIAKEGERLDQIVFRVYGSLEYFEEVLRANIHLAAKRELSAGDVVRLPDMDTNVKSVEEKALW